MTGRRSSSLPLVLKGSAKRLVYRAHHTNGLHSTHDFGPGGDGIMKS